MSEKITAANLDTVIQKNKEINSEVMQCVRTIETKYNPMGMNSNALLSFQILKEEGLIQLPIENPHWCGAIFVRDEKRIPVINTACPRVNQYFSAWHEVYHLYFDKVSFDHVIDSECILEERKAEYFASKMLLGNLLSFYNSLDDVDFIQKICQCMSVFEAPYKAVLISLYESALDNNNKKLCEDIKKNFDFSQDKLVSVFQESGLDDALVKPSNTVSFGKLNSIISSKIEENPDLNYHKDNQEYLKTIFQKISVLKDNNND